MPSSQFEVTIARLQVEHLRETLGIGAACPPLSWQVETDARDWQQAAFSNCRRAALAGLSAVCTLA
jgi:hypothetical protein